MCNRENIRESVMNKFAMDYYKLVEGKDCRDCCFYDFCCDNHDEIVCFGKVWQHDVEKRKKELGAV